MLKVFGATDYNYFSNGDVVLKPLKAKIHKEDNGDYYLDLVTGLDYSDYLVEGNIIVADTPQGEQAFRITNPEKTNTKITLRAWHVFYDSKRYLIQDSYVAGDDKTCAYALNHLNSATEPQSEFATWSDVEGYNTIRCVRKSLYEAILAVQEVWGGHLVRDNFSIGLKESIEHDNGITVEYGKNLKTITCSEDWDDVVTKLLPVGKDGILLNEINPMASVYVESARQYDIPYCKTVTFSQDIDQADYVDETAYKTALVNDLNSQASAYVQTNSLPKVNYTLKAHLDNITDIGDIIEVKDKRLGVNLITSVFAFEYDCIRKRFTEIEFGNAKPKLSNLFSIVNRNINNSVSYVAQNIYDTITGDTGSIPDSTINNLE